MKEMKAEQFTYWLQGFVEINGDVPTEEQWEIIKEHLQTVFCKVTSEPKYSPKTEYKIPDMLKPIC